MLPLNKSEFGDLLNYLENKKPEVRQKEKKAEENVKFELNPKDYHADVPSADYINNQAKFSSQSNGFSAKKLRELAREKLIDEYEGRQNYEKPHCSVTELLACVRQNYYYRMKYKLDNSKYFQFQFLKLYAKVGDGVHEFIQDTYDFTETKKALYSNNYKVKGEADAVTSPYLYEFKSIELKNFTGTYRNDDYYQGNIYAYILNTEYGYKLNTVTLIYFFRDGLNRDPFAVDIPVDNNLAISYLNRSTTLLEAMSTKKVPEAIGATKDKCKYCMYKNYCEIDNKEPQVMEEKKEIPLPKTTFKM